jgi:uncharacterized membrane protein
MATRVRSRPREYAGMAVTAALFAALLCIFVVIGETGRDPGDVVIRAYVAILAVLSLITAEAIWHVRPWAYRAGRALAAFTLSVFALLAILSFFLLQMGLAVGFAVAGGITALIVLPMVGYLRRTTGQP